MKRALIAAGALALLLFLAVWRTGNEDVGSAPEAPPAAAPSATASSSPPPARELGEEAPSVSGSAEASAAAAHRGFIYGRVHTTDGAVHEGRLRWGGGEEGFWGDYFNGFKAGNPWAALAPPEALTERRPVELFGVEIAQRDHEVELGRPFMTRFGDIRRIEAEDRDLKVTLKSGRVFHLDRYEADDLADGVRVWGGGGGYVDVGERRIRSIELRPTPRLGAVPDRLHGTVRTDDGEFTGFVQWNREKGVGSDQLLGEASDGEGNPRFAAIRSIARHSDDSSEVTLRDGRRMVLSGSREVGDGNRGLYVEDPRYGRVLVSWDVFRRVDFSPGGSGPAYGDFPPGSPLRGGVTTRDGRRLSGRLVWDLDESETTETLDAPAAGVDYTIHFGLVAAVDLPDPGAADDRATVTLHGGEELRLERGGDLGPGNAGLLVFSGRREDPEFVPWAEVRRVVFDRPAAMYPPLTQ